MLDSDLSTEHQHRTRAVSREEARRHRRFVPLLLAAMVALAGGFAWAFYVIQTRSLSLDAAILLARNRIEELRNPAPVAPVAGPAGEANPAAMAEVAVFPELRAELPRPHINAPNPLENGLKRVLYQAGENPEFIPRSLQLEVAKAIKEIQADPTYTTAIRRLDDLDPVVLPIFKELQVPPMLTALMWMESGAFTDFEDVQTRRLGAWALTPEVCARHGLDLSERPDPRLDPARATRAARSYLVELFHRGGGRSWVLAAIAYHDGEGALDAIRATRTSWTPDSLTLFAWLREELIPWDMRPTLYRFLAMAVLQEEAVAFRLKPEDGQRRFDYGPVAENRGRGYGDDGEIDEEE